MMHRAASRTSQLIGIMFEYVLKLFSVDLADRAHGVLAIRHPDHSHPMRRTQYTTHTVDGGFSQRGRSPVYRPGGPVPPVARYAACVFYILKH